MCEVLDRVQARGEKIGVKIGEQRGVKIGEEKFAVLITKLFALGRVDDVQKAAGDEAYRAVLFKEFGIL